MVRRWLAGVVAAALVAPQGTLLAQQRRLEHVKPGETVAAGGGARWALIVGVDAYESPKVERLAGAVADAKAIREALVKYADFPPGQAILLTSDGPAKPTTRAILTKLEEIRQSTRPGDMLLFFFAGHGVEVDGQRYLLGYDTDISGPGALKATSLAAAALMHELETIRANHRVIMVDACRNDPTKGARAVADEAFEAAFTLQPAKEGGVRATFLSTSKGQSAYEWTERKRGFFSYYIEKGIAGEAANRGKVTLTSLIDYLNESVPQAVRQYRNREQTPYTKFEGPPFVLVRAEKLPATAAALDKPAALPTRVVYGVVKDSNGTPLRGATVSVAVPAGAARALVHDPATRGGPGSGDIKVTTDEDGFFKIENLPADADLKVTASMQSYMVRTVSAPAAENGRKISLFLPSEAPAAPAAKPAADTRKTAALEAKAKADAEAKARARTEAEAREKAMAEANARAEAEARALAEAEAKARAEAEAAARRTADAAERARLQAEARSRAQAEARARAEAEKQRAEAERQRQAAEKLRAEQAAAASPAETESVARLTRAQEMAWAAYRTFLVEDFREAEKLSRLALEIDGDNALANAVLGSALLAGVQNAANASTARAHAEKALRRDPNLALAHNAQGLVLVTAGDLNGARAAFQKAVQLDPRLGVAHGNLGYIHWQQKRYEEAKRAFEQAANLNPESAIPQNGLSAVLHSMGKFGDAEKACRKAISRYQLRDQALASFYVQLAVALYEQGKNKPSKQEEALEAVARAKALGLATHPAYKVIEGKS